MKKLLLLLLFVMGCADTTFNRVPAYIRIVPTVTTDSVYFDVSWQPISGVTSYDVTIRTMPRIKQFETVRVVSDTIFSLRVHKNDILYPQITVYATAIASLSGVQVGWVPAYDQPPPPPIS